MHRTLFFLLHLDGGYRLLLLSILPLEGAWAGLGADIGGFSRERDQVLGALGSGYGLQEGGRPAILGLSSWCWNLFNLFNEGGSHDALLPRCGRVRSQAGHDT